MDTLVVNAELYLKWKEVKAEFLHKKEREKKAINKKAYREKSTESIVAFRTSGSVRIDG